MGAVLVSEGDHILLDHGYGMADLEWNIPNSPDLGSGGGKPPQLYYTADPRSVPAPVKTPPLTPEHMLSVAPKQLQWKSDGFTIDGRLYLPPQTAKQHVPLSVEVHGGPLGAGA